MREWRQWKVERVQRSFQKKKKGSQISTGLPYEIERIKANRDYARFRRKRGDKIGVDFTGFREHETQFITAKSSTFTVAQAAHLATFENKETKLTWKIRSKGISGSCSDVSFKLEDCALSLQPVPRCSSCVVDGFFGRGGRCLGCECGLSFKITSGFEM